MTTHTISGLVKKPDDAIMAGDRGRYEVTKAESDQFFFKAPSLRNIALTLPYSHAGKVWDLAEAATITGRFTAGRLFERALSELAIEVIHAHSPQAKGRIERLFRTFQDRLVKEMRRAGIHTVDQANEFLERWLPVYNKKFSDSGRGGGGSSPPLSAYTELEKILCIKQQRTVRNDFTIAYDGKLYQIGERVKGKKVMVEERTNGSLHITANGHDLRYQEITRQPVKQKSRPKASGHKKTGHTPALDHPWRKYIKRKPGVRA